MPPVKKPKPQKIKEITPTVISKQPDSVVSGQLEKKLSKKKSKAPEEERGVVFVKHLPHGFFEDQLRNYFKQFGHVTRVRLGRSKRTGGSKGFAFVEFQYPEVAKVAADTMDNYLMFQKVVKASYIPPENQIYNYFKSSVKKVTNKAGKEIYVSNTTRAAQKSVNKQNNWSESAIQKRTETGLYKLKTMQNKYNNLGINFSDLIVKPEKKSKIASEEAKDADQTSSDSKNSKQKKLKVEPKLEDLLGNTINDDSEDEDYVDGSASEESEDEEMQQNSDDDDDEDDELEEDSEEEEEIASPPPPVKKKQKKTGVDHSVDLLKRKPGTGGVQKKKVAISSKVNKSSAKQTLQLAAAQKLAKPLKSVKSKKSKK